MIERKAAMPLLQPIGQPTIDAFSQAQEVVGRLREAAAKDIEDLEPGVAGSYHGVSFWAFFSGKLQAAYEGLVDRDPTTSDQRHCWLTPGGDLCIYLKSNVEELCFEQPMLEGFPAAESKTPALIALTWDHQGADRLHPSFIHLEEGKPLWEMPARELADSNIRAIRKTAPPPALNLKNKSALGHEKRDVKSSD